MKKPIGYQRTITLYFYVNLIGWMLMTLVDWIDETTNYDFAAVFACLVFPVLLLIVYIFFQISSGDIKERFGKKVLYKLTWLGIGALYEFPILWMISYECWIVPQAYGGWENFLNGIEYFMFGTCFVGANAVAWFLFDIGALICNRISNRQSNF